MNLSTAEAVQWNFSKNEKFLRSLKPGNLFSWFDSDTAETKYYFVLRLNSRIENNSKIIPDENGIVVLRVYSPGKKIVKAWFRTACSSGTFELLSR